MIDRITVAWKTQKAEPRGSPGQLYETPLSTAPLPAADVECRHTSSSVLILVFDCCGERRSLDFRFLETDSLLTL